MSPSYDIFLYTYYVYKKHKDVQVDISFRTAKLRKLANDKKHRDRKLGAEMSKKLGLRLDQLRAAPTLDDMPKIGRGRCHELTGNRAGTLSLDLVHPYRLIFEPVDDPAPSKGDGGLDWKRVTRVRILEVTDTHE